MKGALYILGNKMFQNLSILDWRYGPKYITGELTTSRPYPLLAEYFVSVALLACSHQERPSVQNLVKTITHDFVIRLAEPSTLKGTIESVNLNAAGDALERLTSVPLDADLLSRVAAKAKGRVDQKNEAYAKLVRFLT